MGLFRSAAVLVVLAVLVPGPSALAAHRATTSPGSGVARVSADAGFVLPVPGRAVVLTAFEPPATRYGRGHRGVDLAAATGVPVRSAGDGTVVFAGNLAGRGVVSVAHPVGIRTTYEPVGASVRPGQHVQAGTVIGSLAAGHASCAPGSCLHWGARLPDGSYLDPMGLLTGLQVRLKPWDP